MFGNVSYGDAVITDPYDREGVLDKEVEDQGDQADEGQDGDPDHLLLISSIQFILSHAPGRKTRL